MGPKDKGNKSKKKKAAEERKRLLEEEQRQQALKDEKERVKREAKEKETAFLIEKQERKFRVVELEELRNILADISNAYREKTKLRREIEEWERYLLCDGSPDPRVEPEINTYMNLWFEDEERIQIDQVYEESKLCLRLMDEISYILDDIAHQPYPGMDGQRLKKSRQELIELMQMKLDRASHEVLKRASELSDSITANLQVTYKSNQFSLCIWGNISKNPRIKEFDFHDEGIGFSIPKVLRLSDVAVRILFMSYDPYSSHAKSYQAKPIKQESTTVQLTEQEQGDGLTTIGMEESPKEETVIEEKTENMDFLNELNRIDLVESEEKVEEVVEEEVEPPPEDKVQTPEPISYEPYDGPEDGINLREYQVVGGVFIFELLVLPEQPKTVDKWTMYKSIFPSELVRFEYIPSAIEEELTHSSKDMIASQENLNLKRALSDSSQNINSAKEPPQIKGKSLFGDFGPDLENDNAPILVKVKINPSLQILDDTPKLAYWDNEEKEWRTDGVLIRCYNTALREIIFTTRHFGVFAMFQDFHINFPFQAWSIRPYGCVTTTGQIRPVNSALSQNEESSKIMKQTNQSSQENIDFLSNSITQTVPEETLSQGSDLGKSSFQDVEVQKELDVRNHCIVNILSAIHDVTLEILENRVRVMENTEKTDLNFLSDKWFTVPQLIRTMRFYGINIFPREDSLEHVGALESDISKKAINPILESRLYEHMAVLSPSMAFSSCLWNKENRTKDLYYICATEHLNNEPVDETKWGVYEVTRRKVVKLAINNHSKKFSRDLAPELNFHAEFYHMFQEEASDLGQKRVLNIDNGYFHTVKNLLQSLRFMTFCK